MTDGPIRDAYVYCNQGFGATLQSVNVDEAFATIASCFPQIAVFQGIHFKYATRNGITLIERRDRGRFFYWLTVSERFVLIHASIESKFAPMRTIGESLKPNPDPTTHR